MNSSQSNASLHSASDDLKFKEYELARRVGLETISSHNAGNGFNSTLKQLGNETSKKDIDFRDVSSPNTASGKLRRQTSLGQFSRRTYGSFIDNKMVDISKKKKQSFDVSNDVPLWFEKICELDGVTEAETLIVQNEIMHNETQLMKLWSHEARGLVTIKAEESELRDLSELEDLQKRNEELEKESIVGWLGVEALASVINFSERKQLMVRSKGQRINGEQELLQQLENKRREIIYSYYRRSKVRTAELTATFAEGPTMLRQFGELLESTCNNMVQNNKSKLLEEMHKHGIEVGRLKATDATNKLHRKILLNPLDHSGLIYLMHGDLTLVARPTKKAQWGYVHATDGPWRVRRYDKEMVRQVTKVALDQVSSDHTTATDAMRNLAKVLDAIQVEDANLHEQVIELPHRARDVLQTRLTALGITFVVDGLNALTKIRSDITLKMAIQQIIDKINTRLEYHGRFYFEIHSHEVNADDLPEFDKFEEEAEEKSDDNESDDNDDDDSSSEDSEEPDAHDKRDNRENGILDYEEPESDVWMIGATFNALASNNFPGADNFSFGLRSDGTIWYEGKPYKFCGDLSEDVVVGMLLDLNVGSISIYAGGVSLGVAFGVDSATFSPAQQAVQGELIRTQHLIPSFAIKSPITGEEDYESDDYDNILEEGEEEYDEEDDGRMGEDTFNLDESKIDNGTSYSMADNWFGGADGQLDERRVPALSINFGGYGFSKLPPQALSCDSYLSFAAESKKDEDKKFFERQFRNGITSSGKNNMALPPEPEDPHDTGPPNSSGDKNVILEYRNRVVFFDEMQYKLPVSWSSFPPQAHRVGYSANTLQRAIRRFLGRKWRKREMLTQSLAITLLQRRIKDVLPKMRKKKVRAATNIQRVYRGYRARKQVSMALQFAAHPKAIDSAATLVQATIRRKQAKKKLEQAQINAEKQVSALLFAAAKIQSKWRRHQQAREKQRAFETSSKVQIVQRLWRGHMVRSKLADSLDVKTQRDLARIGKNVVEIRSQVNAVSLIQRLWRGRSDRQYAIMRKIAFHNSALVIQKYWKSYKAKCLINGLLDAGPAHAVKRFLKGIGALV